MNKNFVEKLDKYVPKRSKLFTTAVVKMASFFFCKDKDVKYYYDVDLKEYKKKQFCMLADHASRNSFYFVVKGMPFVRFNIMMGYQNFFDKSLYNGFMMNGAIPKKLYYPDPEAVRNTLRLARKGNNIMIFPEGIQSTHGSTHPMNPATLKLIKKLNMDILLCSSKGTYLANPRFTTYGFKKGPMEITYKLLFKKEELKDLSIEEMYDRYLKEFSYNDFLWNKKKQHSYIWDKGNAFGFEKILYKCPICGCENTIKTEEDNIICSSCGLVVDMDNKYNISSNKRLPFERLDQWYQYQREEVKKDVKRDDFFMEFETEYRLLDRYKLHDPDHKTIYSGEGKLIFTKDNFKYIGTSEGRDIEITYDYKEIPSAPFLPGEGFEIYSSNGYSQFYFKKDLNMCTKAMLVIEEMHNLYDEDWNKCSLDVYKY